MMIVARHRVAPAWLVCAVFSCPLIASVAPVAAQQSGPPPPAATADASKAPPRSAKAAGKAKAPAEKSEGKTDAASAQSQVEAGINQLEAGKLDAAVASLSGGLAAGSLPATQTARALYYRGIAYRKQSKPALAIADLTSALWLKGALNEQQRADAMQNRAAAYREAGLADQMPDQVRASTSGLKTSSITTSEKSSEPAAASGSGGLGSLFGSWFGGGETPKQPAQQQPQAQPTQTAPTQTAAVTRSWSANTQVQPAAPVAPPVAAAQNVSPAAAPATVSAPWNAITRAGALPAATTPAPSAQARSAPATGAYRVQVAAVRSNEEALEIAAKLQGRYGRELGGRAPVVDQTVMGNMGTIYRVKVGPYASTAEPQSLCGRLKADGMDCLIVTQ